MMVGIRSWQQQVPLPQSYHGDDAFLFGELDEFGGHCGRADDYHYHYHATPKYPYLNGGFYGVVTERDEQVDPQPRAEPVRPALQPLAGVKITKFEQNGPSSMLTYDVQGRAGAVRYTLNEHGGVDFVYTDPKGTVRNESYEPRRRAPEPRREDNTSGRNPPRSSPSVSNQSLPNDRPQPLAKGSVAIQDGLTLASKSVGLNGFLQIDCTCDGKRQSPAIAWKNAPIGTQSFAVSLWHTAPDQEKSYWLVYNIPADTTELRQNMRGVGVLGLNDKRRAEYDPMCSKGPGVKTYHLTVFALSQKLTQLPQEMDRKQLLEAVKKHGLGQATLDLRYERR